METGYHVTTPKKLARYVASRAILPPVRYWIYKSSAKAWAKKTGRTVILKIEVMGDSYFLPDHQPRMHAKWTNSFVRNFKEIMHNEH